MTGDDKEKKGEGGTRKWEGEEVWGGEVIRGAFEAVEKKMSVQRKDVCLGRQVNRERQRVEVHSDKGQTVTTSHIQFLSTQF